jgi:hypothetical protein
MKANTITLEDLIGFIDRDEIISNEKLALINKKYQKLCENATQKEIDDFNEYYDGLYPPFVAESLSI